MNDYESELKSKGKIDFEKERLKLESIFEELNKLVDFLRIAGMYDLADDLYSLRYHFISKDKKNEFIKKEIGLSAREKSITSNTLTTKREYKDIKIRVHNQSKDATKRAKKYKDLSKLYRFADSIIEDMETKGILKLNGISFVEAVKKYFNEPTAKYPRGMGNNFHYVEEDNFGYVLLGFYRDYYSKYSEDIRNHRL